MTTPDLITTRVAAVILRKSTRTVARMVERGTLEAAITVPSASHGAFLFDRADVLALAEKRGTK